MHPDSSRNPPEGRTILVALVTSILLIGGCTMGFQSIRDRPDTSAVTTGGVWTSMIYATRTVKGVVVIDLGWEGSGNHLRRALAEVNAEPEDVVAVFLTHSHRDHIAAWPVVSHARFHMAEAEVPYFLGKKSHEGALSRIASVVSPSLPEPDEVEIEPFSQDTAFVFGADTIRAFLVPGHTPGSTAYLVRDVVLAGDALSYTRGMGFHHARRLVSHDMGQARHALDSLLRRLGDYEPRDVCTAHAICTDFESLTGGWNWIRTDEDG
jgi:glyoxylase-like metal-dependent hydrolase (beta-lactamase superfamily II)